MGDSGSAGFHCTVGLMREGEPQEEAQNQPSGAVLPLSRRARAEQLAQNQAQVERADMNQLPLQNVLPSSQVAAPHAARFIAMREAAFHQLAAPPEQAASHPPPVLIDRLLFLGLALPVAPPLLPLLRNVTAHLVTLHALDHCAAVVALVGQKPRDRRNVTLREEPHGNDHTQRVRRRMQLHPAAHPWLTFAGALTP